MRNDETFFYDNAGRIAFEHGGLRHFFVLNSPYVKLSSYSIDKTLVSEIFAGGNFYTNTLSLFERLIVEVEIESGRFFRLNAKWESRPFVIENYDSFPVFVITVDNCNLFNGHVEIAEIRYVDTEPVGFPRCVVAVDGSAFTMRGKTSANQKSNTLLLKKHHSVINPQYSPDDCTNCNCCFHSKIRAFFRRLFN